MIEYASYRSNIRQSIHAMRNRSSIINSVNMRSSIIDSLNMRRCWSQMQGILTLTKLIDSKYIIFSVGLWLISKKKHIRKIKANTYVF